MSGHEAGCSPQPVCTQKVERQISNTPGLKIRTPVFQSLASSYTDSDIVVHVNVLSYEGIEIEYYTLETT
jgi:hypothetical protein